jgi:hypothetical protein
MAALQRKYHHWSKRMIPKVVDATYLHDYVIHLRFADGTEGDVDLSQDIYGEIFEPLKDLAAFKRLVLLPANTYQNLEYDGK